MERVSLIASALVAVCLLAATLGSGQGGSVEQQVSALNDEVVQAYLKADTTILEQYFADDVRIIHGDGKLITKAEEIESFKSGALKFEFIGARTKATGLRRHGSC